MIGKLKDVDLREIWAHEALDFTSWLFDNLDILNDQLGLNLTAIEREKSVGSFNVDILAEDSAGRHVIIENQLDKTNHDHLGKVLTYFSNLDAKVGIWISTEPRQEHITAINYLNEVVPEDTGFYLIRLQAFKIGDSAPAPLFTIEAGPSEDLTAGGKIKKEFAQHNKTRYQFFEQLLEQCNEKTKLFSNVTPNGYQYWVSTGAGKSGLAWVFVVMKKSARVEFFIGAPDKELNIKRYEFLKTKKEEIEKSFGGQLTWDFKEDRKQNYIRSLGSIGGLDDDEKWSEIQDDMVNRMIRLEKSLRGYIKILP